MRNLFAPRLQSMTRDVRFAEFSSRNRFPGTRPFLKEWSFQARLLPLRGVGWIDLLLRAWTSHVMVFPSSIVFSWGQG
jgi:hypothetical protein